MTRLFYYSIKNAMARKLTGILTVSGIAMVVFIFCAVLMLSHGLQVTLVDTGSGDNAIVVRKSASTEIVSILPRSQADVIKADPGVARDENGAPLLATEIMVLINPTKRSNGEQANVPVRGVSPMSLKIRPNVKIVEGRMWHPGTSEVIAGAKVARNFKGCGLGETIRFGMRDWTVVGIFTAGGSGFESEVWGDVNELSDAFQRHIFSSVTFRMAPGADFAGIQNRLEADPKLTVDVIPEKEYYRMQSESFTRFVNILGLAISIIFSLGAIVGAMITMYAAVANRTVEIGTLRALGFGRAAILTAFLAESLFIALAGGLAGVVLASLLQFIEISTTNWDTFAELAFSFRMSGQIALLAITFSVVMGMVGGFLPAARAARLKVITALRAK
jgi:putative ABC transport system permease protein